MEKGHFAYDAMTSTQRLKVVVFKVFQRKKGILRMMHGPGVPPQDPTQTPTMANSPFYMTDRSLVEVMMMM